MSQAIVKAAHDSAAKLADALSAAQAAGYEIGPAVLLQALPRLTVSETARVAAIAEATAAEAEKQKAAAKAAKESPAEQKS